MSWRMPTETARHERTWMAFPAEGETLGDTAAAREEGYATWTAVAHAVAEFEPVSMLVDPSELARARRMLSSGIDIVESPVDEFWMRDSGPTFVVDDERPGVLGAVDWIFNGWGAPEWAEWRKAAQHARIVAGAVGAELVSSALVNEGAASTSTERALCSSPRPCSSTPPQSLRRQAAGGGRDVPHARRHESDLAPPGLTRDYDDFGTNGHVDIVATIACPGRLLLHDQQNPDHPDHAVTRELRALLSEQTDAAGRRFEVIGLPAPSMLSDDEGPVDWSYVNHLVTNDGVVACGFGEDKADAAAREILADAYPGRRVVTVDARPLFDRGGGIHCITQQQPALDGLR